MIPSSIRYLLIFVGASLLFLPFLGQVHLFDWDEINFAEFAREMIVSKDYLRMQIDFKPFWEKPPLFIWFQVLAMKVFGINEYAARFPNAIIGITTLLTIFYVGKKVANEKMASWWVVLYAASWLPHFYFKTGIIDPTFNFFIFVAFYQVHLLRYAPLKSLHAALAGLFIGLAVLTKGPVAIVVSVLSLVVYIIVNRGLQGFTWGRLTVIAVVALLVIASWFGVEILEHGWWFMNEFISYQAELFSQNVAGHQEPWYYHPIVLMIGCFPAVQFLFQYSLQRSKDNETTRDFTRWMWILFWVVLILFSIVKTKIVHYSSLCYFPLTYLAATQLYRLGSSREPMKNSVKALLLVIGSALGIAITALPLVGLNKDKLIPLIKDPFAVGNLQAAVSWHWTECLWGALYLVGIWVSVFWMRKNFRKGMITLCVLQILIIQVTVLHFTPKIEAISQRAAIEYFQSFKGKDVYVQVLGYKSYAHLFYTDKRPSTNPNYYNQDWLLYGQIDKPAYFICKVSAAKEWRNVATLQEIGEKNGFVFFKRR